MGEVLPNAIPLMAKAAQKAGLSVNGTVKEMMELQQRGELVSSKVLPEFAELLSKAAENNGGLENALLSNRVAMNRFTMSIQEGADTFFKSGFSEGLTEFFNETATMIRDNEALWQSLGKIFGSLLKAASKFIKVINPVLSSFGKVLKTLTEVLEDFSGTIAIAFAVMPIIRFTRVLMGLSATTPIFASVATGALSVSVAIASITASIKGLMAMLFRVLLPALLLLGVLEEIAEIFSPTEGKRTFTKETSVGGKFSPTKVFGDNAFTRFLEKPRLFTNDKIPAETSVGSQRPIMINNTTTVELDGEKVAENLTQTSTFDESINRSMRAGFVGSR